MTLKKFCTFFGWPLLFLPTAILNLGVTLNAFCTVANGGVMPVRTLHCDLVFRVADPIHECMTSKSRLKFLADMMPEADGIVSIGDQLQDVGPALKTPCYFLWGGIALFCLIRREKFYVE